MIMICQCTTLLGNFDNRGVYACVGLGVFGKSLYFPLNLSMILKLLGKKGFSNNQKVKVGMRCKTLRNMSPGAEF